MGWCRGSGMAEELWNAIKIHIPEDKKKVVAEIMYTHFDNKDADCWEPDMDLIQTVQPEWLENFEEDE